MRHILARPFGLSLLATALSACSSVASLTADSFTFEGQLPPNFSMRAQAHYGVANGCKGRSQARSFESGFQDAPQQYRFKIPVSYRDGLCEMQLARVGLYIHGRYGEKRTGNAPMTTAGWCWSTLCRKARLLLIAMAT